MLKRFEDTESKVMQEASSRIMRIAFILGFSLPFPGAGWRKMEYFAECLAKRGFSTVTPTYILSLLKGHRGVC